MKEAVFLPPAERRVFLRLLLDFGEALLLCGAEIGRTEDTLTRIGTAYGASRMNVYVSIYTIIVTMEYDDQECTMTRRIGRTASIDFRQLEELNALSRRMCAAPLPAAELRESLCSIRTERKSSAPLFAGSILGAFSFAVFFGGNLLDGAAAAVCALFVCVLQERLSPYCPNSAVYYFLCSLFSGLLIGLLGRMPVLKLDKVMIGDIMLINPGIAMMNAFRDMMVGNTLSGTLRFVESMLWAAALACGIMAALKIMGA